MHRDGLAVEDLSAEAQDYYQKAQEKGRLKGIWGGFMDRYAVLNPPPKAM